LFSWVFPPSVAHYQNGWAAPSFPSRCAISALPRLSCAPRRAKSSPADNKRPFPIRYRDKASCGAVALARAGKLRLMEKQEAQRAFGPSLCGLSGCARRPRCREMMWTAPTCDSSQRSHYQQCVLGAGVVHQS
jgi:hypothetical protein